MEPTAPRTVFVVDDDEAVRDSQSVLLGAEGYRVAAFATAAAFGAAVARAKPDCVILDVNLPDLDGIAAMRRLGLGTSVPVIVITGSADNATRGRALAAGAAAMLEKPLDPDVLLRAIETCLCGVRSGAA